jgi:uncharacterized SAM-binding protein YcdF (DUF218 family)
VSQAIVIFGAAVTPSGAPSPALARRIGYGVAAAAEREGPILCSGAARSGGPTEAAVMAAALAAAGVPRGRIVLDEDSRDTLQSAVAAARLVRRRGLSGVVVCTEDYHMARVRMLLAALGVASARGPAPPGPGDAPRAYWRRMRLREAAAFPYDLAVVWWRRRRLMSLVDG